MDFTDNLCYILYVAQPRMEKYPSWLKGLPWKGSRSLVAARGFKSLLLRCRLSRHRTLKIEDQTVQTTLKISLISPNACAARRDVRRSGRRLACGRKRLTDQRGAHVRANNERVSTAHEL